MKSITALLLPMLIFGCSPSHMIEKENGFNVMSVKPNPGKSAIIIAVTTNNAAMTNFYNHINKELIGINRGESCIIKTDIEPGVKYLIARTESLETGKIQFEPDTIYYIHEARRIGWVVDRVSLHPLSPEEMLSEIGRGGCRLYENDKKNPGDDLSDAEYAEAVVDYEREIKEGFHKEFTDYKGFKIMKGGKQTVSP